MTSDRPVPADQVESIGKKLDADLSSLRNAVYEVEGQRVQLNVLIAPDEANAEKLWTSLLSMKAQEAFERKGLTIYEFVGTNDVPPLIEEGRRHFDSI